MRLLLVEDDPDVAFATERRLCALGHHVRTATDGARAITALKAQPHDAVLLDLGLPDADGLEVLGNLLHLDSTAQVIVLTARDEAASAVKALRLGAIDYLVKPAPGELLDHALCQVAKAKNRSGSLESLGRRSRDRPDFLGDAPAFRHSLGQLRAAARSPRSPVLLHGESGTGKEKAAAKVHAWSARSEAPFITANIAAIPSSLLEAELFGHEAGAFTGAKGVRRGLFEMASGGVLFLDEIGELQLETQPKLLRVLEGHPFRRLGGEQEIQCDVRLVTATHKNLAEEVAAGKFREDLWHRIKVLEIELPPLRERRSDIDMLSDHFLHALAQEMALPRPSLSPDCLKLLHVYSWPGNVRELKNTLERAVVLGDGCYLKPRDLPSYFLQPTAHSANFLAANAQPPCQREVLNTVTDEAKAGAEPLTLDEAMRHHVDQVLARCQGNLTHAAAKLGITRGTLRRRLRGWQQVAGQQ